MPTTYYTAIEEVIEHLKGLVVAAQATTLSEVQHVGLADDAMIFDYPL